ncbi:PAN domain-containing protein [Oricola nitratireducens]|uniref:PAN domain-containing protein n=1 Tax=Oricola nitratireducens TaxID=2775868 RepID=UPI0018687BA8|nr:PAN domain-containing protein [Oricola nitratireducens]
MFRKVLAAAAVLSILVAGSAVAADRAIIVMDASGSMWGQIDGKTKIEIARETLAGVLPSIPDDMELGLIAYGHREKGVCSDIEEIVAPAPGTRDAIAKAVNGLNPKGKTPLSDAVRKAAQALKYTEDKATVILITDGIETCEADPCAVASELEKAGVDFTVHVVGFGLSEEEGKQVACLAENTGGRYLQAKDAAELTDALTQTVAAPPEPSFKIGEGMEDGIDRPGNDYRSLDLATADPALCQSECAGDNECVAWTFVKPGIQGDNARCWLKKPAPEQVKDACCISGKIEKRATLHDNVTFKAILAEGGPDYDLNGRWDFFPLENGAPAKKSVEGGYDTSFTTTLQPGSYLLRYRKDMVTVETAVEVTEGEAIKRDLPLGAGVVSVSVLPDDGADVDKSARFDIESGDKKDGGYGSGTMVVPAGDVRLSARLGKASAEESVALAPGEIVDRKIVVGIGIVAIDAVYAEGGPAVEGSGLRVDVLSAKKSLDGKRKQLDGGYGPGNQFKLPPGDYIVQARLDKAIAQQPVTVTRGEMTDVVVNLNAGVLYASAPGAYRIDVFEAKTDLQGKRKQLDGAYGEEYQITLNPGDYLVVATMGDNAQGEKKETQATITAAERTEVKVE